MAILTGCCGFPFAQGAYYRSFSTVELNSPFYALPRLETAQKWRREAPEGFVFSLKAWQLVTHPFTSPTYRRLTGKLPARLELCGHFQDTDEVRRAWERVEELAQALKARCILFQTPPSFHPGAGHLRDIYRFFKRARRGRAVFVWEPRGAWDDQTVSRICADLGLVHGTDPFIRPPLHGSLRYFRLHGRMERGRIVYSHNYSDAELKTLLGFCEGRSAFVYFNNTAMRQDARRFKDLSDVRIRGTVSARRPGG
ncbi:MAG: DUF72 domain-containing protein [Elusimicrobia bacterium]|nr:DUF72 domain-containing protein [Elusimicrobiota bacterium]